MTPPHEANLSRSSTMASDHAAYYNKGSTELATETPLTLNRLEPRRKLTKNSERLVIALVGLPARGKSFVARKMQAFLMWNGVACKVFNVGKYRREAAAAIAASQQDNVVGEREKMGACDANFFDSKNEQAAALREKVAHIALEDMLGWLDEDEVAVYSDDSSCSNNEDGRTSTSSTDASSTVDLRSDPPYFKDRIAIFDATNSTVKRRKWILEQCRSPHRRLGKRTGVVFVESICDDRELLEENFRFKVKNSPDFKGMSFEEALADLRCRVLKYEEQYETIADDSCSYIKIFNLSTKLLVNHIYGRMARLVVPALMAWNIGTRPVFLCRPGETPHGVMTDGEDYVASINEKLFIDMSTHSKRKSARGYSLGDSGKRFRDVLFDFVAAESANFLVQRASIMDMAPTGTSSSYSEELWDSQQHDRLNDDSEQQPLFPLHVLTSTMPRAAQTCQWRDSDCHVEKLSYLNPLDKGDFAGMEFTDMKKINPDWYAKLEQDPFQTRFPGGESYRDLISRLNSVIIDIEQQVIPTLVVSHVSILQTLIAYFRNSPVEKCMEIEVPMHTVVKFTPVRGGGWSESRHHLCPTTAPPRVISEGDLGALTLQSRGPIWGDHVGEKSPRSKRKAEQ